MSVPALVTQAAAQTSRAEQCVVSTAYDREFHVRVGPSNRADHLLMNGVYENGMLIAVHVVQDTLGRTQASSAEKAQTQTQCEHPQPGDLFRAPWDPRYLADYTYSIVNPTTIAFTSDVKDTAHGSGTFTIDGSGNVLTYQYAMSANLEYVTRSSISGQRAEVVPGCWEMTHEVQQYTGRYHGIPGTATTDITQSQFVRFSSAAEAGKAIGAAP
jgi:hypothetical protein